jgi:hypothetical protein
VSGIFRRMTDEERQAEASQKQEAEYEASPAGQAATAFARGDAFFQIEILLTSMSEWAAFYEARRPDPTVPADVLGRIEAAGWRLEHASWVSDEMAERVKGVYLFRRNDRRAQRHANASAARAADLAARHSTAPMARLADRWPHDTAFSHRANGFSHG